MVSFDFIDVSIIKTIINKKYKKKMNFGVPEIKINEPQLNLNGWSGFSLCKKLIFRLNG